MNGVFVDKVHGAGHLLAVSQMINDRPVECQQREFHIGEDHAYTDKYSTQDGYDPMQLSMCRPSKLKQANWRVWSSQDHGRKSILWLRIIAVLLGQALRNEIRSQTTNDTSQN